MALSYQETIDYLFAQLPMYQRIGSAAYKKDLTNTLALCKAANNPHEKLKCLHVAGTNGKGSVSHILASVLQEQGYKVGLYISPHYKDFRERIKVNGSYITETAVIEFVEKYKSVFESVEPSFFEMTVVMAFDYFVKQEVDYAVIEVGLGGRLDSTNVINPLLSIITNISYDHMDMLGNTLGLIAGEKAGIIKPHIPIIIGETHPETENVFINKAKDNNAEIIFADQLYNTIDSYYENNTIHHIQYQNKANGNIKELTSDLLGKYQLQNIKTAFVALEKIQHDGIIKIDEIAITNGLKNVVANSKIIGRFQIVHTKPTIILDSAHNEDGVLELMQEINELTFNKLHIVLGTVKDKDLNKIFPLLPSYATYYFCKASITRGLDSKELQNAVTNYNLIGDAHQSVIEAYETAKRIANKDDLIVVCGSIFVVAEVI